MPRIGPKIVEDYIIPSLENCTFGDLLKWEDAEKRIFLIRWNHKSGFNWSEMDTTVFQEWDKLKNNYFPDLKDYLMQSKQRFRSALYKSDKIKELTSLEKFVRRYKILDVPEEGMKNKNEFSSLGSDIGNVTTVKGNPDSPAGLHMAKTLRSLEKNDGFEKAKKRSLSDAFQDQYSSNSPIKIHKPSCNDQEAQSHLIDADPIEKYINISERFIYLKNAELPSEAKNIRECFIGKDVEDKNFTNFSDMKCVNSTIRDKVTGNENLVFKIAHQRESCLSPNKINVLYSDNLLFEDTLYEDTAIPHFYGETLQHEEPQMENDGKGFSKGIIIDDLDPLLSSNFDWNCSLMPSQSEDLNFCG